MVNPQYKKLYNNTRTNGGPIFFSPKDTWWESVCYLHSLLVEKTGVLGVAVEEEKEEQEEKEREREGAEDRFPSKGLQRKH